MFPGFHHALALAVTLVVAMGGCASTASGIGGLPCSKDTDCSSGLRCLATFGTADAGRDGGCTSTGSTCLEPCTTDTDCTIQGYLCASMCGGAPACLPSYGLNASVTDAANDAPIDVASQ